MAPGDSFITKYQAKIAETTGDFVALAIENGFGDPLSSLADSENK